MHGLFAQLRHINARDYESTSMGTIMPNQGLNITGRCTDNNKTGIAFISLGTEAWKEAIQKAAKQFAA